MERLCCLKVTNLSLLLRVKAPDFFVEELLALIGFLMLGYYRLET